MNTKKKIIFLVTQSEFGGAQRFIYRLIEGLRRYTQINLASQDTQINADISASISVSPKADNQRISAVDYEVIVAAGPEGDDEKGLLSALEKKGINVRHLKYLRRSISPLFDFLGLFEIYRLMKKERPDIVFLCSTKAGFIGSLATHLYRRYTQIELPDVHRGDTQIHAEKSEFLYADITYKIRGACFKVWKEFRGTYKEKIVERALAKELQNQGLKIDTQKQISVFYDNENMGKYVPDMIVDDKILVELKSKTFITKEDEKQFWLYLKGSSYKLGLLINFGKRLEIKRKVYDTARGKSASISVLPKAQNQHGSVAPDYQRESAYPEGQDQRVSANLPKVIYRIGGWTFNDPWPNWKKKLYIWLEKRSARFKDIIVNNAEADRQQAIKLGIKPKDKIITIYNGINTESLKFLSREEAQKELFKKIQNTNYQIQNTKIIGTIADLYPTKGLRYLIEVVKILKDEQIKFVIIGQGKERKKLEKLIKKYNLEKTLFLVKPTFKDYKYLKAFDIFVLPSVKEGFPWTVLEAMAAEVPIIATKVGAIPEIIENNKSGILVEPGNSEELAEAIKKLIINKDLREKFSKEAKKTAEEKFNLKKMTKKYESLFLVN